MGATVAAVVARGRKEAAKVLLKSDTGVLGDAGGIGIEGLEKIPDLLLDQYLLTALRNDLPWLDVVVHFPIHPHHPQRNLAWASKEAAAHTFHKHVRDGEVFRWGRRPKYLG
jgi:hypothetical protein